MITKMHHISAIIKSAKETTDFYTTFLGLRLVKNTVNQENTAMRHLFFGDYLGSPGSLLTFFEIQKVGNRQDKRAYFSTVYLAIPKGSLPYWQRRFLEFDVPFLLQDHQLHFQDADHFKLAFVEQDEMIEKELATRHSSVPREKQIIRILGTTLATNKPTETEAFLKEFLGLSNSTNEFVDTVRGDFTQLISTDQTNRSRTGRGTIDHIAYSVKNVAELDAFYRKAQQMGITIEEYVDRGYFKSLYIREPAGLRIELATETPGFLFDETAEHLGERLALPDFLESQRTEIETKLEELK